MHRYITQVAILMLLSLLQNQYNLYRQNYCGCVYSLRDSNKWREETGRQKIEIGKLYYTPD